MKGEQIDWIFTWYQEPNRIFFGLDFILRLPPSIFLTRIERHSYSHPYILSRLTASCDDGSRPKQQPQTGETGSCFLPWIQRQSRKLDYSYPIEGGRFRWLGTSNSNGTRICQLKLQISECKHVSGESLASYYGRLSWLWDEVAVHDVAPTCATVCCHPSSWLN